MDKEKNNKGKRVKELLTISGTAMLLLMFLLSMFLSIYHGTNDTYTTWQKMYVSFAMASLISTGLLLLGWAIYLAYKADMFFVVAIFAPLGIIGIISLLAFKGWKSLIYFITGAWIDSKAGLILSLIGIVNIVLSAWWIYLNEFADTKKKNIKTQIQVNSSVDDEACLVRIKLMESIKDNALRVKLTKKYWVFPAKEEIQFGYDVYGKQFVLVNTNNSHTISSKQIVFLDYEDQNVNDTSVDNVCVCQRLIKLYSLGGKGKEHITPFILEYSRDSTDVCERLDTLRRYANRGEFIREEIGFRRKIRYIAATLDKASNPRRPFAYDDWFTQLKECMGKVKNTKTDGYTLFRNSVIENKAYLNDQSLRRIIEDLSKDPPDTTSARREAKKLCFPVLGGKLFNK